MRYLTPQTFLLLVAAAALLLGGGLWWVSQFVGHRKPSRPERIVRQTQAARPLQHPTPQPPQSVAPLLQVEEVAPPDAPPTASATQPEAAKILRRNRGFSSANQSALSSGSHATVHVAAKRPKPLA